MIQECLDLRKKYVYKENIPLKTEPVDTNFDPYNFEPVEATTVSLLLLFYYFLISCTCTFAATCVIFLSYL